MRKDHLESMLLYSAGELGRDEAAEFETHLASCAECRLGLRTAEKASEWAKAIEEDPSPELLAEVLSPQGRPSRWNSVLIKRLGFLSTAAAAAIFVISLLTPRPGPRGGAPGPDEAARKTGVSQGTLAYSRGFHPFRMPGDAPVLMMNGAREFRPFPTRFRLTGSAPASVRIARFTLRRPGPQSL